MRATSGLLLTIILFVALSLAACSTQKETAPADNAQPTSKLAESRLANASQPADGTLMRSKAEVDARVAEATERLTASEEGELILAAIEAHGGLANYFSKGPLSFRFDYHPVDEAKTRRHTTQTIDTWSARARHALHDDTQTTFGWTGEQAWRSTKDLKLNARFWALTPYYFVGIPFVLADPGATFAPAGKISFEEESYDLVKVTFRDGVGDAPDDFYIVYVHEETKRVGGVRYIVSYPGFYPNGGHSPEKFMRYDGAQDVDGIIFPETFRTFTWNAEENTHGALVTNSKMLDVAFAPNTKDSFFNVPQGAEVLEGY
ncbi:MAG: hypothetical protein AAGI01_09605 [Myxococcota bacterium]